MKQMRNKRTGKLAVYDESLIALGTWEPVVEEQKQTEQTTDTDCLDITDDLSINLKKGPDESVKRKA